MGRNVTIIPSSNPRVTALKLEKISDVYDSYYLMSHYFSQGTLPNTLCKASNLIFMTTQ